VENFNKISSVAGDIATEFSVCWEDDDRIKLDIEGSIVLLRKGFVECASTDTIKDTISKKIKKK